MTTPAADLSGIVTPTDKRQAIVAAIREREQIGLATVLERGAREAIYHLEQQANRLAWQGVQPPSNWSNYDAHCEAMQPPRSACPVPDCCYCKEEGQ